jgi:hypothetical protein
VHKSDTSGYYVSFVHYFVFVDEYFYCYPVISLCIFPSFLLYVYLFYLFIDLILIFDSKSKRDILLATFDYGNFLRFNRMLRTHIFIISTRIHSYSKQNNHRICG